MDEKEKRYDYEIGYVPGVFDLFHIGHLNLIRRAKEKSRYLIAGVLSDELVEHFKGKKPVIPFEERLEIVGAICGVDKVVKVDFTNTVKMDAWKLYHFDAYFSGSDHGDEWNAEKEELQKVGSDIVFLPYTQSTSSTSIKRKISEQNANRRVYLYGAGKIGAEVLASMCEEKNRKIWKIEGFLDYDKEKHLTRNHGITVFSPDDLKTLETEKNFEIILALKDKKAAYEALQKLGYAELIVEHQ